MKIEVHRDDMRDSLCIGVSISLRDLKYINDDRLQTSLMRATFATEGSAKLSLIINLLTDIRHELDSLSKKREVDASLVRAQYEAIMRGNAAGGLFSSAGVAGAYQQTRNPSDAPPLPPLYGHKNKSGGV